MHTTPATDPLIPSNRIQVELLLDGPYPVRVRVPDRAGVWQYMDEAEYSLRGLPPIEGRLTK